MLQFMAYGSRLPSRKLGPNKVSGVNCVSLWQRNLLVMLGTKYICEEGV